MPQIIPYMSPMGAGLQSASNTLETAQGLEMQKAANQRAQERHAELMQRAQLQRERDQAASQAAQWQAQYMGVRDAGPSLDPIQEVVQQLGPLGAGAGIGYAHGQIEALKQRKRQEAMNIMPQMDPRDAARFAEAINAEAIEESRYLMRDKVKEAWVQSAQDGLWGEGDEASAQMVEGVVADLESGAMEPEQAAQVLQQRKIQLAREQTLAGLRDVNLKRGTEMANAFSGMLSGRQEAAIMMLNSLYSVNYRTMKPEAYMEQMQSILLRKDSDAVGRARTEAMSRAASGLMENGILPGTPEFDQAMQGASAYFGNQGPRPAGAPVTPGGMEYGAPGVAQPQAQPSNLTPEQAQALRRAQAAGKPLEEALSEAGLDSGFVPNEAARKLLSVSGEPQEGAAGKLMNLLGPGFLQDPVGRLGELGGEAIDKASMAIEERLNPEGAKLMKSERFRRLVLESDRLIEKVNSKLEEEKLARDLALRLDLNRLSLSPESAAVALKRLSKHLNEEQIGKLERMARVKEVKYGPPQSGLNRDQLL